MVAATVGVARAAKVQTEGAWRRPFAVAAPQGGDLIPAGLTFSSAGLVSVAYGVTDQELPASASAHVIAGRRPGVLGAAATIPDAQATLGLAYLGSALHLLTGTSPASFACCSTARALTLRSDGSVAGGQTLIGSLDGATLGDLIALPKRLLAVVASADGVRTAISGASGRFAKLRLLASPSALAPALAATALSGGRSLVAWTSTVEGAKLPEAAQEIAVAIGGNGTVPRAAHVLTVVPAGDSIDSLAVAAHGSGATVAWVQGSYTAAGARISQVHAADLAAPLEPRALSPISGLAERVSLTSDARGDQAIAWQACTRAGSCQTDAALRPLNDGWRPARALGELDSTATPALAQATAGPAAVVWVSDGRVRAALAPEGASRFTSARTISADSDSADVTVAFSPAGHALAVWTEGTARPGLMGAWYQ